MVAVMEKGFSVPVLLNVFNRPNETEKVLSVLKTIRPRVLYIHCDGPRIGRDDDNENVNAVKNIIEEKVNWPCDVHKLFEPENLGCGRGPAAAMSWFFKEVEEGIILEDDCCPNLDFFVYCQTLLEKYRDNDEIGIISGTNFSRVLNPEYSYRFSKYAGIWGWATWKRNWDLFEYDFDKPSFDFIKKVLPFLKSVKAFDYWFRILELIRKDGQNKTYWDYQLHLCLMYAHKIHILPNYNLVSNIGFGENATHTFDSDSRYANRATETILPISHPQKIFVDAKNDNKAYASISWKGIIVRFVKRVLKNGK